MSILRITRIVHSNVLVEFGRASLLLDPWFSERSGYYWGEPLGKTVAELPKLSEIAASHKHYDHYDIDAPAGYPHKDVPFIVKTGMGLNG